MGEGGAQTGVSRVLIDSGSCESSGCCEPDVTEPSCLLNQSRVLQVAQPGRHPRDQLVYEIHFSCEKEVNRVQGFENPPHFHKVQLTVSLQKGPSPNLFADQIFVPDRTGADGKDLLDESVRRVGFYRTLGFKDLPVGGGLRRQAQEKVSDMEGFRPIRLAFEINGEIRGRLPASVQEEFHVEGFVARACEREWQIQVE